MGPLERLLFNYDRQQLGLFDLGLDLRVFGERAFSDLDSSHSNPVLTHIRAEQDFREYEGFGGRYPYHYDGDSEDPRVKEIVRINLEAEKAQIAGREAYLSNHPKDPIDGVARYPLNKASSLYNLLALYQHSYGNAVTCFEPDSSRESVSDRNCYFLPEGFDGPYVPLVRINRAIMDDMLTAIHENYPELILPKVSENVQAVQMIDALLILIARRLEIGKDFTYAQPQEIQKLKSGPATYNGQTYEWYVEKSVEPTPTSIGFYRP